MKQRFPKILLGILILTSIALQAQIPSGYYNNATDKTGTELKSALHNIIKGHNVVSYDGLLDAYAYTDCDSNGKIWDIYSNYRWNLNKSCGNYDGEGDCWNREHTWPQSWFKQKSGPKSDLFHVMPTDGYVNGRRSNFPYGEVNNPDYTSGNGSKLGPCSTTGYSGTVFEPVDEYKGDIARNYFYMSVRYYTEDSGWGSSGMTNKSVILDWAMDMLLRWHDADPVSQKEIDRNNAVYGYQGNRNPFIDHPEYARMIWDPNYVPANQYDITYASNISNGTVSGPAQASEGSTVAITATPNAGYMVSSYFVYKTGDANTTVSVTSDGTFTMPAYNVTVSASFAVNNTYYAITTDNVTHGSISVSPTSAKSGTTITMTANPATGYSLYSWYVYKTGDMNTIVYSGTNNTFTMPSYNVTVSASFSTQGGSTNSDYVKVTSAPTDWSGTYLIVYEDGNVAFNGGLTTLDVTGNTISVNINNNSIPYSTNTAAAEFTIAQSETSYTIQSKSGYYIGATGNANSLNASTSTAYTNTITFNNGDIDIVGSGGAYLRYNANTGQERFRYFKSSTYTGQKAIQLYKKEGGSVETPTHTIHFNSNGGEGTMNDQTVDEFVPTALSPNTFTREGFEFDGWNTQANGEGQYYADNANITLMDDITLYAQWDPKFTITVTQADNGVISASATTAVAETTISLTAIPNEGYEFDSWIVTDGSGNSINVVEDQFEMPADNVTVTAIFVQQSISTEEQYVKVTSSPTDWSGDYLIVYEAGHVAFNGGLTTLDAVNNTIVVSIDNETIPYNTGTAAAEFTIAQSGNNYTIQSKSGFYIGQNSDTNGLSSSSSTAYSNTISMNGTDVNIVGAGGAYLRYNATSGQERFRYYKSTSYTSQKAIQLYKKVSGTIPVTTTHTITFYPNGASGNPYIQTVTESVATALTANSFTREGYDFTGWNTQADGSGTPYYDMQTVSLTTDLELYAQWGAQVQSDARYYRVTNTDMLEAGRSYLIVNIENSKALGKTQNSNNRSASNITLSSDTITNIGQACELTLGGSEGAWTFYDANLNGYLYAASSTANQLKTQTINDENGEWAVTIEDGVATITAQGSNTRNTIRYNTSGIFSCYVSNAPTTTMPLVALFVRSEEYEHLESETIANLFYFDKHIVHNGAVLTVSGNATCNDASLLVIEDGGQLIHHNDGVKATFKKSINAYTQNGGWYTIATAFTVGDPDEITTDDYDLYAYQENADLEWINHKNDEFSTLVAGQGYLYAHSPATTVCMTGTLNNGDLTQTANLSYGNADANIKGFNLLGNPTAHEITFDKTSVVSDGYYYLDNNETWSYRLGNTVPAGCGFLVKANATGQTVTLNPQSKRGDANDDEPIPSLVIEVDGTPVYVKLSEGVSMPLLSFKENYSQVYLTHEGKPYIMLTRDNAESIDLNFQPNSTGQHHLSLQVNNAKIQYLHLIDRMNGNDIDLLANPSYTFSSQKDDHAERFQLRF